MSFILVFFVAAVAGATLLAAVIVWSTNRSIQGAITRHFQDSDYILSHRQPPPDWLKTRWGRQPKKRNLLSRLDKLQRFYQNCTFFDSEDTREELLDQLSQTREKWQANLPD